MIDSSTAEQMTAAIAKLGKEDLAVLAASGFLSLVLESVEDKFTANIVLPAYLEPCANAIRETLSKPDEEAIAAAVAEQVAERLEAAATLVESYARMAKVGAFEQLKIQLAGGPTIIRNYAAAAKG